MHVQIHHIDEDPSNHDLANLALLCLDCHNDTQVKGGFGRKLNAATVRKYRDDWTHRVDARRRRADDLLVQQRVKLVNTETVEGDKWERPSDLALISFVQNVPDLLKTAYDLAQPDWDTGATGTVTHATYQVVDVVARVWVQLAACYPPNHFGKPAAQYISEYVAGRIDLRYALIEPEGPRTRGTMVAPMVAHGVLLDVQELVVLTVRLLLLFHELSVSPNQFEIEDWEKRMAKVTSS
jgi:hypothetical protein